MSAPRYTNLQFVLLLVYCWIGTLVSQDPSESTGDTNNVQISVIAPAITRQKVAVSTEGSTVSTEGSTVSTDGSTVSTGGSTISTGGTTVTSEDLAECPDPELIAMVNAKHRATSAYNTTVAYWKVILGMKFNYSMLAFSPAPDGSLGSGDAKTKAKMWCLPVNRTENDTLEVRLVNSTSLLQVLGNKNDTSNHCTVVLFFAPWCMFCAQIAPHYNALARAFPQLHVLAIDAVHFSSLNTRYGTIAVPNLLVFYNNSKAVAKFNHTERNFNTIVSYVTNITGFKADPSVQVLSTDYEGPLSSKPTEDTDWLLWLAWTFVFVFCFSVFAKSSLGQSLWNALANFGIEHEQHID